MYEYLFICYFYYILLKIFSVVKSFFTQKYGHSYDRISKS